MFEPARWGVWRKLMNGLDTVHLARPALRAYEFLRAARAPAGVSQADGLPIPPARLRATVGPEALDTELFLRRGKEDADRLRDVVLESGRAIETMDAILDWGCNCGRVLRHWQGLAPRTRICGSDINARAVEWCRANLPFAEVSVNELAPPFPYPDSSFDFLYAISVFTHLPENLQDAWMQDCRRVLKPGGLLFFTTLGEHYASFERLTESELQAFSEGELVVLYETVAGSNLCSAYHPPAYVKGRLGAGFELRSFVPGSASIPQDAYLFRAA